MKYFTICLLLACAAIGTYAESVSNSTDCPVNEEFLKCGTACEPSCSDKDDGPKVCTRQCIVNVCQCKKGFVRNAHKQCVKRDQCGSEKPICPVNEEFLECGSACEPKCSDEETGGPRICTMNCIVNVCQCKVGFVRNDEGNCVRKAECDAEPVTTCDTLKCPENMKCEVPTFNCFTTPCPQPPAQCVSSDPKLSCKDVKCPSNYFCVQAMAICLGNGPCDPQTPPKCVQEKKEDYNPCAAHSCLVGQICQPKEVQCVAPPCKPVAECVPQNQTSQCPKNEVFNACGGCENTCENKNMICPAICGPGKCVCGLGFYRHNGVCVEESECSAEEVDPCATVKCSKGQECRKVEVRCFVPPCKDVGQCFDITELEQCGENEKFNSCGACDGTCENPNMACPAICRFPGSCGCILGYVRSNGKCIAQKDCPEPTITCANVRILCKPGEECGMVARKPTCVPICSENEVLGPCSNICEKSCATRDMNLACRPDCSRGPECACAEGFYRNPEGKCVTEDKCELKPPCITCSEDNEELKQCGTACEPSCQNPTPICTKQCVLNVCQCKHGFVRDANNKCIEQTKCPVINTCENTKCGEGEVCQMSQVQCKKAPCPPVPVCVLEEPLSPCASMRCKYGYLCVANKMDTGNGTWKWTAGCVLQTCETKKCPEGTKCEEATVKCPADDECPRPPPICVPDAGNTTECGSFEELKKCGTACEPSCANLGKNVACTEQCLVDVCQCQDGYVRDENKRCILEKECPKKRESGCALMDCFPKDVCVEDLTCSEPQCMAKCVPREQARPPCHGFECPAGQECFEEDHVAVCR